MWNESSSDFGVASPILFKPAKKSLRSQNSNSSNCTLDLHDLHKQLLLYLKKSKKIPRNQLNSYLEQVTKLEACDHKNRWLLMKIKGLLKFILKKRSDFQDSIVDGKITIYEKSISQQSANLSVIPPPPKFQLEPENDATLEMPSEFLSNNNFVTQEFDQNTNKMTTLEMPSEFLSNDNFVTQEFDQNANKMDTETSYNYSQDLFADNMESLHNFSQANYQIWKELTTNKNDKVFKVPPAVDNKINQACKIHDSLEESYNTTITLVPKVSQTFSNNSQMDESIGDIFKLNIFDDLTSITNEQLQEQFNKEFETTNKWVSEVIHNLISLENKETFASHHNLTAEDKEQSLLLNDSFASSNISCVKPYYSEENLKIIRETCSKYRRNLENKDLGPFQELFNTFQEDW